MADIFSDVELAAPCMAHRRVRCKREAWMWGWGPFSSRCCCLIFGNHVNTGSNEIFKRNFLEWTKYQACQACLLACCLFMEVIVGAGHV